MLVQTHTDTSLLMAILLNFSVWEDCFFRKLHFSIMWLYFLTFFFCCNGFLIASFDRLSFASQTFSFQAFIILIFWKPKFSTFLTLLHYCTGTCNKNWQMGKNLLSWKYYVVKWDGEWWFYGTTSITKIFYFTLSTFPIPPTLVWRRRGEGLVEMFCNLQFVMIFVLTKWQTPLLQEKEDNQREADWEIVTLFIIYFRERTV